MIDLTVVVPLALDQIFFKNCLEFNVIQFACTICGCNVHPRFFGNGIGRNVLDIHVFHNQVGLFQNQTKDELDKLRLVLEEDVHIHIVEQCGIA